MNYSFENTILFWANDRSLFNKVRKISSALKLNIFEAKFDTDILAVPYFFAIIDGQNANKDTLSNLKEIIITENPKEFAVLLTRWPKTKIPAKIKKLFIKPQEVITDEWLKTTILNKKSAIIRHKKNNRSYDKTIFRTVSILRKLMRKNSLVFLDDLCTEYNVSDKTIRRDFELLRSMGEDIIYDKNKKGYRLQFSLNEILHED